MLGFWPRVEPVGVEGVAGYQVSVKENDKGAHLRHSKMKLF